MEKVDQKGIVLFLEKWKEFSERTSERFKQHPDFKKHSEDSYRNYLGGPIIHNVKIRLTRDELFESELFQKISEIYTCLDRVHIASDITLIRKGKITPSITDHSLKRKNKVLRLRFEYFLTELYIVEQRIKAFLGWIENKYNKSNDTLLKKKISQVVADNGKTRVELFKQVKAIRHSHTHETLNDDHDLEMLDHLASLIFLLSSDIKSDEVIRRSLLVYSFDYNQKLREVKRKHKQIYEQFYELLTVYFNGMLELVFSVVLDGDGKIIYPFK